MLVRAIIFFTTNIPLLSLRLTIIVFAIIVIISIAVFAVLVFTVMMTICEELNMSSITVIVSHNR